MTTVRSPREIILYRKSMGELCCACGVILPEPWSSVPTACKACAGTTVNVCCEFKQNEGWLAIFRDEGISTPLGAGWYRTYPDRLRELQQRYGANRMLEDVNNLEAAIAGGRGAISLRLPVQNYFQLRRDEWK